MSQKVKTITLGCRFNFYESEVSKAIVKALDTDENVIIVNTCSVTKQAENQSKQAVRKAIRESDGAKVLVTGCAVTTCQEYFNNLAGIYKVIPNEKKSEINSYSVIPHKNNIESIDLNNFKGEDELFHNRVKVFLQVQTGCDNFCSYCIVPFARGRSKSLPVDIILDKVKYFYNQGFKEIVLSGIDITSYGRDLSDKIELSDVIKLILDNIPELQRIRISSMNPNDVNGNLLNLILNESRILPHLHLSIQTGNNNVLKQMRRNYTVEYLYELINKIKQNRPEIVLGADIIAGFPSETNEQFEETLNFIRNSGLSLLHIFPFSPRPGTLAAKMIQLPKNKIIQRAAKLRELALELKLKLFENLKNKTIQGLIEKKVNNIYYGKTNNYINFELRHTQKLNINTIVNMKVSGYNKDFLICDYIN